MAKRRKLQRQQQASRPSVRSAAAAAQQKPKPKPAQAGGAPKKKKQHQQHQHEAPTIPFRRHDRILLIGEGDLSFAASIIEHQGCTNLAATVLEKDHAELVAKYPAVDANIAVINRRPDPDLAAANPDSDSDSGPGPGPGPGFDVDSDANSDDGIGSSSSSKKMVTNRLIYGVDATKLPPSITRTPHDHIIFNFPHVGGKSTDVNRQVRYNQELLVSFFQRAVSSSTCPLAPGGTIIVTLFEGEPYTLWNIRDLARHAGLEVERSFRFQADSYPGYRHARTLGVVRNKKGEEGGGWKGEDRPARSYVFVRKGDAQQPASKKRRRGGDDDDDSSSDDD